MATTYVLTVETFAGIYTSEGQDLVALQQEAHDAQVLFGAKTWIDEIKEVHS